MSTHTHTHTHTHSLSLSLSHTHRNAPGAILSIVAGLIAIGVALLGIVGAIGLWRPLLVVVSLYTCVLGRVGSTTSYLFRHRGDSRFSGSSYGSIRPTPPIIITILASCIT